MLIKWQFLTIFVALKCFHKGMKKSTPIIVSIIMTSLTTAYPIFFLTNNIQSVNLCENGLSIILFFYDQINNFMRKNQSIKKLQFESVFFNQVFK